MSNSLAFECSLIILSNFIIINSSHCVLFFGVCVVFLLLGFLGFFCYYCINNILEEFCTLAYLFNYIHKMNLIVQCFES